MKLYIDTTNSEKIIIKLNDLEIVEDAKREKAQKLLEVINRVLTRKKIDPHNLTSIEVNTGPGSFTGLRVGISVANTLGWSLGIPVNGRDVQKSPIEPVYR